jgi:hypothetical protein
MSEAMREKDSADYDLERFIEMFDTAMTSNDPRVQNALRQLMMMVILTDNSHENRERKLGGRQGPLRRITEELNMVQRRMHDLANELSTLRLAAVNSQARSALDPYVDRGHRYEREGMEVAKRPYPSTPEVSMGQVAVNIHGEHAVPESGKKLASLIQRMSGHK